MEGALKENKAKLSPVEGKAEMLAKDIDTVCKVLDNLASCHLSEPAIANVSSFVSVNLMAGKCENILAELFD